MNSVEVDGDADVFADDVRQTSRRRADHAIERDGDPSGEFPRDEHPDHIRNSLSRRAKAGIEIHSSDVVVDVDIPRYNERGSLRRQRRQLKRVWRRYA